MSDDLEAREAVRGAYQAYYRRLVATLYGLTGDHSEAQDLVQEAYARALARPRVFLDVADPEAWLRTVAVNLARTRWRRRRLFDTMLRSGRITPAPESTPAATPDRVLLINALQKLSRPTRETIVLHHVADMSVHEVAETLGVPVGTVKARLSRGRALLANLIGEREAPREPREPHEASRGALEASRGALEASRRVPRDLPRGPRRRLPAPRAGEPPAGKPSPAAAPGRAVAITPPATATTDGRHA